jgi:hypothetical protein
MFYIEEKSWNYFPYTVTEYSVSFLTIRKCIFDLEIKIIIYKCSFLPKFQVTVQTRYLDDCGERENVN